MAKEFDYLTLPVRLANVLQSLNIQTHQEAAERIDEIWRHRGVGRRTMNDLLWLLKDHGVPVERKPTQPKERPSPCVCPTCGQQHQCKTNRT